MGRGTSIANLFSREPANGTAERWRRGLHLSYTLGWLRTEENNLLAVPPEKARELPRRAQELLGYAVHDAIHRGGGYLGMLGLEDPVDLLEEGRQLLAGWDRSFDVDNNAAALAACVLTDEWVAEQGIEEAFDPPHRFEPTRVESSPPLGLDLTSGEIRTIVWATGYRPDHSWLNVPVFDRKGRLRHDGGVVDAPGLYVMGLPFLRRRKSSFIDGAGDDAHDLAEHLCATLHRSAA